MVLSKICLNCSNNFLPIRKCMLVCKNCHYELHELYKNNQTKYWNIIKQTEINGDL